MPQHGSVRNNSYNNKINGKVVEGLPFLKHNALLNGQDTYKVGRKVKYCSLPTKIATEYGNGVHIIRTH